MAVGAGRGALTTECSARFAGRRKAGGGYTYYDFMQDRNFDIAGPNPTAEERKKIDRAYMGFLDAQRREAVSAELAKRQNEQLRADLESARHPSEVRSSPDSGSAGITVAGPFGATTGLVRRSKSDLGGMACPFRADSVAKVPKCAATNFPPKDETNDNRRSMCS